MQMPLQLTFRHLPHSDTLEALIRRRAERLEHLFARIISCHVVVELAGHHHHHGDRYIVAINLGVPGRELLVKRTPSDEEISETAHTTTDRAFDEMARQLEDWVKQTREHRHDGAHGSRTTHR